jgi:ABC-2 type transport system permease protein
MVINYLKRTMRKDIIRISGLLVALIVINLMASEWFFRVDLTAEKRFTLSDNSKTLLRSLDKEVDVTVYLDGELNPGFKKLSKATSEMLEEFGIYAQKKLVFRFVDPNEGATEQKKMLYEKLQKHGCEPVPVFETTEDGRNVRSMVFPYALVSLWR